VSFAQVPDHFTCYKAKTASGAPNFVAVPGVTVVDHYRASTVEVKKPERLCAPTNKLGEDPTAPTHPDHLEGYKIKPTVKFVGAANQRIVDQFGSTLRVDAKKPAGLLVPTLKNLSGPPPTPANPAVDHFQCYKVKTTPGTPKFVPVPNVTLEDQFGTMTVLVKKPRRLCAPVNKNNEEPGAENHPDHLMCYLVKQTSLPKFATISGINVNNQFGPETLDAKKPAELCVPALVNPPTGPTPTATPPPGPTVTQTPGPAETQTPTPTAAPTEPATPTETPTLTPGGGVETPTATPTPSCDCPCIADQYRAALNEARACSVTPECSETRKNFPGTCYCPTFINPANTEALAEMERLDGEWNAMDCDSQVNCPGPTCGTLVGATCTDGRCEDIAP
jgi:hypothetical protein